MKRSAPEVLYEDAWIVVVNKPSGELTHPGWARGEATTMSNVRDHLGQHVQPLHRLDRGTSGVVVLSRDAAVTPLLFRAWQEGGVRKRYWALVRGTAPEEGLIDYAIPKDERGSQRVPAVTRFVRVGVSPRARCSLVEAEPLSGRLHQLRRHFKHLFHPLVGDVRYGDGRVNREFRERFALHRLALHASSVSLTHPVSGERLEFHAPLTPDLELPLAQLGLLVRSV